MTETAAPTPHEHEQAARDPARDPAHDLVEITRAQLAQQLAGTAPTAAQKEVVARGLGLSAEEVAALVAGTSDLRMSSAQYALLKTQLAKQYTSAGADRAAGSLCGASATPDLPTARDARTSVAPVEGTKTALTMLPDVGKNAHVGKVDGGVVTLRTNVQPDVDLYPDSFSISYKGKDSKNEHWLQFIHREIIGIHADGSAHPVVDTISSSGSRGGTYKLTQGGTATTFGTPKAENYNTDSPKSDDPFYEAGGAANRTATSTTMIDTPSTGKAKVDAAFAAGAKKVVSRAHFDTFLVHVDKVTYHVQVTVSFTLEKPSDEPRPTMATEGGGAAANLPSEIQTRFHAQYPDFNFIK